MIVFPRPNCSTTCNILNQHLEVINTIKAILIQHFMRVLRACQSTLARHPQDNARISLSFRLCLCVCMCSPVRDVAVTETVHW